MLQQEAESRASACMGHKWSKCAVSKPGQQPQRLTLASSHLQPWQALREQPPHKMLVSARGCQWKRLSIFS